MLIGLFSDIHANHEALTAVLERFKIEGAEQYLCLGDLVGYGASPNECIDMVKNLPGLVVGGNHDYAVVGKTPLDDFNPIAAEAVLWTKSHLTQSSLRFLESLELIKIQLPFLLVHSTPSSPASWNYVYSLDDALAEFSHFETPVGLIGHSHQPFVVVQSAPDADPEMLPRTNFILQDKYRYLINIGSVGQPRDGDPRSCACLYNTESKEFQFLRLVYDIRGAQEEIIQAGLPPYLANRLSRGI